MLDIRADEILNTAKSEAQTAFPYGDCQKLALKAGVDYQGLVSALDTYFYDVWSPSNGIKKLPQQSAQWLTDLKIYLGQSFFMSHPEYASLEAIINQDDMHDLYRHLVIYDRLRKQVIVFLSTLVNQR